MASLKSFPYLNFNGNCEEAMEFYKSCIGGKLEIMRYDGSPVPVSDDLKQKVMHCSLKFDGGEIMAADAVMGPPVTKSGDVSIMLAPATEEDGRRLFDALSAGGKINMPYEKVFWGAVFGAFIDKFGTSWLINYEKDLY